MMQVVAAVLSAAMLAGEGILATRYTFEDVSHCNMCAAEPSGFQALGLRLNRSQGRNPKQTRGVAVTVDRCTNCGLIFPNPTPIPENILDHYSMPADEYWRDNRARPEVNPVAVRRFEKLRALIPSQGTPRGLEIGAGSGARLLAMEGAGFEAHGLEPIPQFLEVAKEVTGIPADRLQLAGIDDAQYPDDFFDFISFSAVLEHLYDPAGSIVKALRWLKPSGLIYAEVPSSRHMMAQLINTLMRLQGTNLVTHTSPMHSPFHLFEFDERSFQEHGRRAGYELADIELEVCTIRHAPAFLHPMLRAYMERTRTGMQMHVALRKHHYTGSDQAAV